MLMKIGQRKCILSFHCNFRRIKSIFLLINSFSLIFLNEKLSYYDIQFFDLKINIQFSVIQFFTRKSDLSFDRNKFINNYKHITILLQPFCEINLTLSLILPSTFPELSYFSNFLFFDVELE